MEIGVLVSTFLFGLATVQAWIYYERFPDDSLKVKLAVGAVWLLTLGHAVCDAQAMYVMAVTDYGQPEALAIVPLSIYVTFVMTGVLVVIVQGYYAYRILMLTKQLYIPIVCWVGSSAVFVTAIVCAVIGFQSANAAVYYVHGHKWAEAGLTMGAIVDTIIAITLCWYFNKQRNTTVRRTARTLGRLMSWTLQSGALTSLTHIIIVICYQTMSTTYAWVCVWMITSGVIANSFYALLNARVMLRNESTAPAAITLDAMRDTTTANSSNFTTSGLKFVQSVGQESVMSQSEYKNERGATFSTMNV